MDPFSVAGSAVGVTSLGLQVCQGLIHYYAQFRSFHDDVDAVVQRVARLENTLQSLECLKCQMDIQNPEKNCQLREAILATEQSLKVLQKQVTLCGQVRMPGTFRDRARLVRKRLLWPFRQESLADVERALDRAQSHLMLVLQIVGFAVEGHDIKYPTQETKSALVTRDDQIQETQNHHSTTLQAIQNDVQELLAHQWTNSNAMSSQLATMLDRSATFSPQLSAIEQKLEIILSSDIVSQRSSSSLCTTPFTSCNIEQENPRRRKISMIGSDTHHDVPTGRCDCHQYLRKHEQIVTACFRWLSFPVSIQEASDHLPNCAHFSRADFSRTVELCFVLTCTRSVKYCIRVGWFYARRSGWNSLSPVLRYRPVVSHNSPGFKPFLDLLGKTSIYSPEMWKSDLKRELYEALSQVRNSFSAHQASPFDVLDGAVEGGLGIFAFAFWLSVQLFRCGALNSNEVITFLGELEREGVPLDGRDDRGINFFCTSQSILFPAQVDAKYADALSIYSFVIMKTRSWSVPPLPWRSQALFEAAHNLLTIESFFNDFEDDSALILAVLQRSETDLSHLLSLPPPPNFYGSPDFEQALSYAVSWPKGLGMLLSYVSDPSQTLRWGGSFIFYDALGCGNEESVRLLIQQKIVVRPHAWPVACRHQYHFSIHSKKEIFAYIANALVASGVDEDFAPYYDAFITPVAAQALWDAGHCNFEAGRPNCSALWFHSIHDFLSTASVALLSWFISKGANIAWINPRTLTSPAHAMAHTLARGKIASEQKSIMLSHGPYHGDDSLLVKDVLLREQCDLCVCPCSAGGCQPIGCLVKKSNCTTLWKTSCSPVWVREKRRQLFLLNPVYWMIDKHRSMKWIASTVLRILTFEELQLTHTCCYRMDEEDSGWFKRPSEEERSDIRYIEGQSIDLLEMLMLEFEAKWELFRGTFEAFVDTVWMPRMDEACGPCASSEDYMHDLRQIGVVLEGTWCD